MARLLFIAPADRNPDLDNVVEVCASNYHIRRCCDLPSWKHTPLATCYARFYGAVPGHCLDVALWACHRSRHLHAHCGSILLLTGFRFARNFTGGTSSNEYRDVSRVRCGRCTKLLVSYQKRRLSGPCDSTLLRSLFLRRVLFLVEAADC